MRRAGPHDRFVPLFVLACIADLTAARGLVTLSTWTVAERIRTAAVARAEALASTVRIAELVAMRPGGSGMSLLRRLGRAVPGGPEALDLLNPATLADAARAALSETDARLGSSG